MMISNITTAEFVFGGGISVSKMPVKEAKQGHGGSDIVWGLGRHHG